jgi:UDP-N-acetylmuramoyl-tripeptide--D-alanyl-D-alanine ligase
MMSLAEAAAAIGGSLRGDDARFQGVSTDSRSIGSGELFVAIRGEHFDGHGFLDVARARGASGAMVDTAFDASSALSTVTVEDTRKGLGRLGRHWRLRFAPAVIAITGSNGKTTVKEMLASILRRHAGEDAVLATAGNLNNDIGLPLTLLKLEARHRCCAIELGMNHKGEIAYLAGIARPGVALVNNAQREHLEFMATVEAVARENGTAIAALADDGVAVFPADDAHAAIWREIAGARRTITFALHGPADVSASAVWHGDHWVVAMQTPAGAATFSLRLGGTHNVRNALAASAAALAAGSPLEAIVRGLESFVAVRGRSQAKRFARAGADVMLIDDSYNANPDSVRAAIDVLAALPAPRWLVLGDMGEVGDQGPAFHREVGAYAAEKGIESLWAAGAESANTTAPFAGARAFADVEALLGALGAAPPAASVLVKGSRFMRMERVVAALTGESAGEAHAH